MTVKTVKSYKYFNLLIIVVLFQLKAAVLFAQNDGNEKPDYTLDAIVVVADRTQNVLQESTSAASVLDSAALRQLPIRNLSDALSYIPGLSFVEKDGSANMPVPIVRGFYGGGETEYILLTIDGIPVNDIRTGLVEWSQIPVSSIQRIEVLRGGGSALYGDMAIGAVINIVTFESKKQKALSANLVAGQENKVSADITYRMSFANQKVRLAAFGNQSDGFRSHSQRKNISLQGWYEYKYDPATSFYSNWNVQRIEQDDPGPLTEEQIDGKRNQSNALFNKDFRNVNRVDINFGLNNTFKNRDQFSVDFGFRLVNQKQVRTLLLAPNFGDTQYHDEKNRSFWLRAQYLYNLKSLYLVLGIDSEYGDFESHYYANQDKKNLLGDGTGNRFKTGLFLEAHKNFGERIKASAGLRYDLISSDFENKQQNNSDVNFDRLTPRLGLNFAYITDESNTGHLFINWVQSFKAPTLDQLFDQRQIAAGPPGEFVNFSNSNLRPQYSNSIEAGVYQRITPLKNRLYSELTFSAYRINLRDEIDFDLNTFKYGNILKSRHDGFEGAIAIYLLPLLSINSVFNLMNVNILSGENSNNQLKNITKKTFVNTLNLYLTNELQLSVSHKYIGKVFLDDENTASISAYQTCDSKLSWSFEAFHCYFSVFNLMNKEYNSSGYALFDPFTMSNVKFLYPSQSRYMEAGIEINLFNK